MKFYLYKKCGGGGGRTSFGHAEEGHNKLWGSFYAVT